MSRYDRKGFIMDIDNRTFAYIGTSPGEYVRTVLSSFNRSARIPLS
jgi:hypothetical protein